VICEKNSRRGIDLTQFRRRRELLVDDGKQRYDQTGRIREGARRQARPRLHWRRVGYFSGDVPYKQPARDDVERPQAEHPQVADAIGNGGADDLGCVATAATTGAAAATAAVGRTIYDLGEQKGGDGHLLRYQREHRLSLRRYIILSMEVEPGPHHRRRGADCAEGGEEGGSQGRRHCFINGRGEGVRIHSLRVGWRNLLRVFLIFAIIVSFMLFLCVFPLVYVLYFEEFLIHDSRGFMILKKF